MTRNRDIGKLISRSRWKCCASCWEVVNKKNKKNKGEQLFFLSLVGWDLGGKKREEIGEDP